MVWNQARLAKVNKGREIGTVVPIGCEVGDASSRKNRIQPQKKELLEFPQVLRLVLFTSLCRGLCRTNVVPQNQSPNESKSKFLVVLENVRGSCTSKVPERVTLFTVTNMHLNLLSTCLQTKSTLNSSLELASLNMLNYST